MMANKGGFDDILRSLFDGVKAEVVDEPFLVQANLTRRLVVLQFGADPLRPKLILQFTPKVARTLIADLAMAVQVFGDEQV